MTARPLSNMPRVYVSTGAAMLSEALRLIRVFHDMKQTELAQRLGISKSYLSEIEKDR